MPEGAIDRALAAGRRPADMMEEGLEGAGTAEMAAPVRGAPEG